MKSKFDALAKGLAQSGTRRQALKRFGAGLAGMALACFGRANKAEAGEDPNCFRYGESCCSQRNKCCKGLVCYTGGPGDCYCGYPIAPR